jgi:calcineurin-like phosphoesterase family protein
VAKRKMPADRQFFFTGDTHFGHRNMIKHANRPYSSVEEMNEDIITRWNKVVNKTDIVVHLGDFCFGKPLPYLEALNGEIWLVLGNHDYKHINRHFEHTFDILELVNGTTHIFCCHYPCVTWNKQHYGSLHFHGHCHGTLEGTPNRIDVGVDSIGFTPLTLDQIWGNIEK